MILPSHNPLASLTNDYASPNNKFKSSDSIVPKIDSKKLAHEKIFNFLIYEGIINSCGSLNFEFKGLGAPDLKKAQFDRIQELLIKPFIVKSKDDLFELTVNFKDLFIYLNIERIEIVGGTVYWILGEEYMREVCKKLNIPIGLIQQGFFSEFANPAADIDLRVMKVKDLNSYKKLVCAYLATLLPQKFNDLSAEAKEKLIFDKGLTKYFTQINEQSKEHVGVISFGNRHEFGVDLLFVENLKRKYLFKHDAVKIVISKEPKKDEYTASLNSNTDSVLESLILRLTKILNTEHLEEIDLSGACMLFSYLTKGWRYHQPGLESMLISTFLNSYNFAILSKLLANHYPDEQFASTFVCFNACSLMPEDKNLLLNISKQILKKVEKRMSEPLGLFHFNEVLMHLNSQNLKREEVKLLFDGISAYFQIFGLLSTVLIDSNNQDLEISPTVIKEQVVFQIKFKTSKKPFHITVKNDSALSLNNFKNIITNESLLKSLQNLSQHFIFLEGKLKISEIHVEEMIENPIDLSKHAFNFLEDKNWLINHIGFYLLCYSGIAEKNSSYLNFLILNLMVLLMNEQNPTTKKNLLYSLIKYWLATPQRHILLKQTEAIEAFYDNIDKYDIDHTIFCLLFSKFEIREISTFIFNTWEHFKYFDIQLSSQLIENFKDHDPYSALKILKKLSEEPSSKCTELKKSFDLLVAAYAKLENKLIEERDLLILADIAEQLISKLTSFKHAPKQDEMKYFIDIIGKTVKLDFVKGAKLLKKLEEKNGYNKGLKYILRLFFPEDKLKFVHQLVEQPLDSTATNLDLVERIELFLSLCTINSDAEFLTLAGNEILKTLTLLFKGKKPGVVKLKEIIVPHLEWLLLQFLNQIESGEKPQELILLYFKITEALQPKIIFNQKLVLGLILGLKTILFKNNGQYEFVKTHLAKLENRNSTSITEEELELYQELTAIYLKSNQTKVASDFLKILLRSHHSQNRPLTLFLKDKFEDCYAQFMQKKGSDDAMLLLEHYENFFPENPVQNEAKKWKELIFSISNKQNIKKMEILIKKSAILKTDQSIINLSKEIVLSFLSNKNLFTDKKQNSISLIFKLIEGYQLSDLSIIQHLKSILISLKDKDLNESAFWMFTSFGVSLSNLTPLLAPLSFANSNNVLMFLKNYKEILANFSGLSLLPKKKELIQEYIAAFLKSKSIDAQEIEKAYSFLEAELKLCGSITIEQQNEMDLKYCKSLIALESHDILNIWKKLHSLAINVNKKEGINDLLQLYSKGIISFKKSKLHENLVEPDLIPFLDHIKDKVTPEQILPYFDFLSANQSIELLKLAFIFAATIIESCPFEKPENLTKPYLQFKYKLNELADVCFEKDELKFLPTIIQPKFFTSKEIYSFKGRTSKTLFSKSFVTSNVKNISYALKHFKDNIGSLEECPLYQKENLLSAIHCLLSLVFIHGDIDSYLSELIQISLQIKIQDFSLTSIKKIPIKIREEKYFQFYFNLVKMTTIKLMERKNLLTGSFVEIALNTMQHIKCLMPFIEKKEEIISLFLDFSYVIIFLPKGEAQNHCVAQLKNIIQQMEIEGFFNNINTADGLKNSLKLYFCMVGVSIPVLNNILEETKAEIILEILNTIVSYNTQASTNAALRYFNLHANLLMKHFEDETTLLFAKLNYFDFDSISQNYLNKNPQHS